MEKIGGAAFIYPLVGGPFTVRGGSWCCSSGCRLVTFRACLSARPLKSRETLKGLGQAPTQPKALPAEHRGLSLAFMTPLMALTFVPQRWHPNLKRCLKTQKITYGEETTFLTDWFFSTLALCWTWMHLVESRDTVRPKKKKKEKARQ